LFYGDDIENNKFEARIHYFSLIFFE